LEDVGGFFKRTLSGSYYETKNNFSLNQKQKIMNYLYYKNTVDLDRSKLFTYLNAKDEGTKESIQNRVEHLKEMKQFNRAYFIYNLGQCQNRLRTLGIFSMK
jgi:GTP-dependent phosphoenolpyruvate carboxykinase